MSFAMSLAGLAFAFVKGWMLSFVIMGIFPFMIVSTSLITKVQQGGFEQSMKAYGQSAGYAD